MLESGKLVHKIGFDIDKKSWDNLNKFQKRIGQLKSQMSGLTGVNTFKVNMSSFKQQADKVAKVQATATKRANASVKGGSYTNWWETALKDRQKAENAAASKSTNWGKKDYGTDKTYSSWWTEALNKKASESKALAKQQADDEKRYNKYWDNLSKADNRGYSQRTAKQKKQVDTTAILEKRKQKIENMRSRLDYQMRKSGVSMQGRDAFFGGTFNKAAQSFKDTGDIQTFTTKVGLASRQMIDASRSAKTMGKSLHDMRSMMVAATQAYTAFAALQSTANTGMQLESMQAGMKVFAGSDANVKREFDYIVEQSRRMGVNFEAAAQQYTKFNIVARNKLSTDQRKEMFESMSEYATVLQVDPEQYKRAFTAINQMLSKGSVQSEELDLGSVC